MPALSPVVLTAPVVELRPLEPADAPALFAALDHAEVWASGYGGGPAGRPTDVDAMAEVMATRLRGGTGGFVWTVRLRETGEVVGTSTLGDIDIPGEAGHLGWTAYSPAVWGSAVNPATKLAILTFAFEHVGLGRVHLQVDALNERSQAAVAKLGAVREGVLRRHKRRADGSWRDSVIYSVLRDEWPALRAGLAERLEKAGHPVGPDAVRVTEIGGAATA